MFGIGHFDIAPLVYGIIIFLGIWSIYHKFTKEQYDALAIEVVVFTAVFWLHGGSMAGGFAAAVAALLAGYIFPKYFKEDDDKTKRDP